MELPIIKCAHTRIVPLDDLKPNPANENAHSKEQILALSKIISENGQRAPIVVSKRSGFITKGHGRLAALKLLGSPLAAVDDQDYADDLEEMRDRVADNEIARYAEFNFAKFELNLNKMNLDVKKVDLRSFGILDLTLPEAPKEEEQPEQKNKSHICPQCNFQWES